MPGDDRNRPGGSRGGAERRPGKGGKAPNTGSRGRSDRARREDEERRGPRRSGASSGDRGRDPRGSDERPDRGPRKPIKGKRRVFDEDSAPNERERARSEKPRSEKEGSGEREQWIDEGPVRKAAGDAVRRGAGGAKPRGRANGKPRGKGDKPGASNRRRAQRAAKRAESVMELDRKRLEQRLGKPRADRTVQRLGDATAAYAEERYEDARKTLKPIVDLVPDEPAVRELYGLALYRLGRWRPAIAELEEFVRRTGSTEQHPVLADCYRALGQHVKVEELWDEIGEASLAAPLVAEGRIVMAGSLADQGKVVEAIGVLEGGALGSSNLKEHHLRMRYVLGDLYDRAGDHQAARRYFESIAASSPGFFDVQERLRHL